MAELLIHSMAEFADIILPALQLADARRIAEIGAEYGGMSTLLAGHVAEQGGRLYSIDPEPKPAFIDWVEGRSDHVEHVARPSLEAIGDLSGIDAWIVDGDHNWYTVYNELQQIAGVAARDGNPLLVFLHDIAWPCARRDMYYAPDRIPAAFRHAHGYDAGVTPDDPGFRRNRGFRGAGAFAFALEEGGPRNGVLTAIEDFLGEQHAAGRELGFAEIPAVFGLGVIFDYAAPYAAALAELLLPFHDNRLLRSLERNRLTGYLHILELQDQAAQQRG